MKVPVSSGKRIALLAGPIVAYALIFFYHPDIKHPEIGYTLAIAAWMAIWWISEAVPLAITSLLPVALFPLLGIMDGQTVSPDLPGDVSSGAGHHIPAMDAVCCSCRDLNADRCHFS